MRCAPVNLFDLCKRFAGIERRFVGGISQIVIVVAMQRDDCGVSKVLIFRLGDDCELAGEL